MAVPVKPEILSRDRASLGPDEKKAFDKARASYAKALREHFDLIYAYTRPVKPPERMIVGREGLMKSMLAAFERPELSNVLLLAEAGSGKALEDTTPIPVVDGREFVPIGKLSVGDRVFSDEGTPCKVVGVFPQGKCRAWRVSFSDGTHIVCNEDHLWRTASGSVLKTKDLRPDETRIPSPKPLQGVGGGLYGPTVYDFDRAYSDVPKGWRLWNLSQRRAYASRLLPLNAHIVYEKRSLSVIVSLPTKEFAAFMADLLRSLGVVVSEPKETPWSWRIEVFWAPYSAYGLFPSDVRDVLYVGNEDAGTLLVTDVEELDYAVSMACIKVDSPNECFLAGPHYIVTHNTALVQGLSAMDDKRTYLEVDLARMIAAMPDANALAASLKLLFDQVAEYNSVEGVSEAVLFMDEFHQIVQISAVAVEALKPLLADSGTRGIRVICATTYREFRDNISKNQPLVERLQRINVPEPDRETTVAILHGMAERYGVAGAMKADKLYDLIYEYTERYIPANAQPRKSLLVLDAMIGWHKAFGRPFDRKLLADVLYESEGVNVAFRVDASSIKKNLDAKVFAQDFATSAVARRLQLCVADLNDHSKPMTSLLFTGSTGVGKALTCSSRIPVFIPDGSIAFKKAGDVKPGDYLFARDGSPTRVFGVFPQGERDVYRVTLGDGRSLDVSEDHLWAVYPNRQSREDGPTIYSTKTLLAKGLVSNQRGGRQAMKYQIPMNGAVQWPEADLPLDPYTVGAFIANGCLTLPHLAFSSNDEEVVARIAKTIPGCAYYEHENGNNYTWIFRTGLTLNSFKGRVNTQDAFGKLPEMIGVKAPEKRIPKAYMTASIEQRWELIRGLFDSDGSIGQADGERFNVSYSTASEGLAYDIQEVLFSLGVASSVKQRNRTRIRKDGTTSYEYHVHVKVENNDKEQFFWLSRKREIARSAINVDKTRVKKFDYVGIRSIEKLDKQEDMVCFAVENYEHLYQAGQYIVTHNTELSKQLAQLLFDDERALVRVDMTEYANSESLERFRDELTTRVWERPFCVILLDEIEKSCAEVTRLLLQVLDDGRLIDRNGREVSFLNAYIIMTTNVASEVYQTVAQYRSSDTGSHETMADYDKVIRRSIMTTAGDDKFPPELLGRIDTIVPFQPLSENTKRKIVISKLRKVADEIQAKHNVTMHVTKRVVDYLVGDLLDEDSNSGGAREVVSKLEEEVTCSVAEFLNAQGNSLRAVQVDIEGELASENKRSRTGDARVVVFAVDR